MQMINQTYGRGARFDTGHAMSEDDMRRAAPSIFANTAHDSRSDRFRVIPTIDVLRALQKEGFQPVGVKQSVARTADRTDYTKHLVRLRRMDGRSYQVGDTVLEMLLKNANDGSAAYDLMAGLFRIACLNSLVSQTSTLDSIKVRHSGDVAAKVIEGTYRVLGEAEKVLAAPAAWSTLQLAPPERMALAEAAHVLRFADADGEITTPIVPAQLLNTHRHEDAGTDLWTTFNVVQENVIRGGLRGRTRDANNRMRRVTTRAVNGIDQDVRLNKALWILAERLDEMKRAA